MFNSPAPGLRPDPSNKEAGGRPTWYSRSGGVWQSSLTHTLVRMPQQQSRFKQAILH